MTTEFFTQVKCLECEHTMPADAMLSACESCGSHWLDAEYDYVLVVFNATDEEQTFVLGEDVPAGLSLHPVQAASADAVVREAVYDAEGHSLTTPARTTAVFVVEQEEPPAPEETQSPEDDSGNLPAEEEDGNLPTEEVDGGLPLTAIIGIAAVVLAGLGWIVYKQVGGTKE